MRQNILAI